MRFAKRRLVAVAGLLGAFVLVGLAVALLNQPDVATAAPSFTAENAGGDVKLTWSGNAKRASCTRIDGVRGQRALTNYAANVSGKNEHTFDVKADGAYVCVLRGASRYRPAQVSTCDSGSYDRDDWGSYPPVPEGAKARWSTPEDNLNDTSLQHDHHVALRDAHDSGACGWSEDAKDGFSSETMNLNPTAASFNASKGSRSPDELTGIAAKVIDTNKEKCDYALQHVRVKRKYGLVMTPEEQSTAHSWMRLCRR